MASSRPVWAKIETMARPQPAPGWYPDPDGSGGERHWDGERWTTERRAKPSPNDPEPAANWYPDPDGSGGTRYWDGERWTKQRRPQAEATTDVSGSQPTPRPSSRAKPSPYARIRPAAAQNSGNPSRAHYPPITAPMPFWKRNDPVRVVASAIGILLVVVVAVLLVTQLFGHSPSWQTGYDAGSHDPTSTQKIINEGGQTPDGHCQNLLTLARMSSDASKVDATDFLHGCRDGVEQALKVESVPLPAPQTVYVPVPAQPSNPREVQCNPLGRWDPECELGKP
jgi:hypothetical protein